MSNAGRDNMPRYNWLPTPEEFIRAATLAWLHVGCEALALISCAVKRTKMTNVSASKRRNQNEN